MAARTPHAKHSVPGWRLMPKLSKSQKKFRRRGLDLERISMKRRKRIKPHEVTYSTDDDGCTSL